jgi:hypothetical protein
VFSSEASSELAQASGVTMRSLRLVRYHWILRRDWARYVDVVGEVPPDLDAKLEAVNAMLARTP